VDEITLAITAGIVAVCPIAAALLFRRVWVEPSKVRRLAMGVTLLACTLMVLFLLGEVFFKYFWLRPDGLGVSLHNQRWQKLYAHPMNSRGYRDVEHGAADFEGKRVAFVAGDSFMVGAGLRDYRKRVSNVLATRLGDSWEVVNIAIGGSSTGHQYAAIASYPRRPDIIVLSYYINDVAQSAE
jgi:hypothetical protein